MSYSPTTWVAGVTKLGPTNLNHLEGGVQAAAAVADSATTAAAAAQTTANAALPTPAGTNGQFLKKVSGLWVPTSFAVSDIPDPTTGKVLGSSGGACAAVFPPGYELNYTERTTAFTITATTEAASTTVLSPGAIVFDGAPVAVEFFAPLVTMPAVANAFIVVSLWEGVTELGQVWVASTPTASILEISAFGKYRFTPTAGSHTYTIKAFATSLTGTPQIIGSTGGVATTVPTFVRFVKV